MDCHVREGLTNNYRLRKRDGRLILQCEVSFIVMRDRKPLCRYPQWRDVLPHELEAMEGKAA